MGLDSNKIKRKRTLYYYKILRDPRFKAIDDSKLRKYLRLRAQGAGVVTAANAVGVTQSEVERWRREVADVAEIERDIEDAKIEFAEKRLLESVAAGKAESIKFLLQNRRPEVWGRADTNVRVDVSVRQRLHAARNWQEMLQDAREAFEALQAYAQATRQALPAPGEPVPAAKALQAYRNLAIRRSYAKRAADPHQPPQPVKRSRDEGREPSGGFVLESNDSKEGVEEGRDSNKGSRPGGNKG